jgi:hypothetical protein
MPAFGSPIPLPIPGILNARGVVSSIRWSSSLRGRHRTMAANPDPRLRGKRGRAHTETTVLGQVKKTHSRTALLPGGVARSQVNVLWARGICPDQLMGCSGLCPLDPINLNISNERAQGHFLSPWSKSGAFYTKEPRHSLCVYQCGSRKPAAGVSKKTPTFS